MAELNALTKVKKTKCKQTSNTSGYATAKAQAVITPGEIGRIVDLGLGRGLDHTKEMPWLNKSSFQVRPVLLENIIGTEEGGALQNYEREIVSIQDQRGELKASITVPQSPVSIGVDAEQSRSHTSTRRSVGKKIVNRTISFRADFHDAPSSSTRDPGKAQVEASLSISTRRFTSPSAVGRELNRAEEKWLTFEERLCRWILERAMHRAELRAIKAVVDKGGVELKPSLLPDDLSAPVKSIGKFIQECTHDERKEIVTDCKDFVYNFRITHYVSAIELGAAEYRVMSEEEYETRVGMGGSFGFEAVANAAVKETARWKKTKRASDLKRIGLIKPDGTVERGSYGEAVVGIQIQPISSLVKIRYLQLALQQALLNYSSEEGNKSSGPFILACNNDEVFLRVDKDSDYSIEGTINLAKASAFHIVPSDGSHPNEFMLSFRDNKSSSKFQMLRRGSSILNTELQQAVKPMPRFLNARANITGKNHGPLQMSDQVEEGHVRLVLQSRVQSKKLRTIVDPTPWVTGRDVFFIRCARRRFKKEGYLCIKFRPGRENGPPYKLCIVPSIEAHNTENRYMLFRLMPVSIQNQLAPVLPESDVKEEESGDELSRLTDQYRRFSAYQVHAAEPGGDHNEHLLVEDSST